VAVQFIDKKLDETTSRSGSFDRHCIMFVNDGVLFFDGFVL